MRTKLCELLDIEYPIILAPMAWIGTANLAAAVSEAGGLGTIGPNAGMMEPWESSNKKAAVNRFQEQLHMTRSLTSKTFAVNIPVGWGKQRLITDLLVDVAIEEKLSIVLVSQGSSKPYTKKLKKAGIKVIHAISSVEHAKKAYADGVDAVVCEGYEAGGHLGKEELPLFVLIPQVADTVDIPVVAAGGIVDARGVVASFALGAQGVLMGTRFMATHESPANIRIKEAVIKASDSSTVVFARKTGISRCLKNEYTKKHIVLESKGASFEEMRDYERTCAILGKWRRVPGGLIGGNIEEGSVPLGAGAGMIKKINTCSEIIYPIIEEYKKLTHRLNK